MKTVWRFALKYGSNKFMFPEHAHILCARENGTLLHLYVLVRTEKNELPWHPEVRNFYVVRSHEHIPDKIAGKIDERKLNYISTAILINETVHVFEVLKN